MTLTQEQIDEVKTLFNSEDFSHVKQGIGLVDALIDNEADFLQFVKDVGSTTLTEFSFEEFTSAFAFVSDKSHHSYLVLWTLRTLAQWNTSIYNLTELKLSETHLTTVPEFIGNLTNLRVLSFYKTNLTELPDWIGNLTNLTKLYLNRNNLTRLPESIGNLTNLNILGFADNPISESELERLKSLLPNCKLRF